MSPGVFITGGNGKTGLALLERMSSGGGIGADVTCLCRSDRCRETLSRFPVRIARGDASDARSLGAAYGGEETVIHLSSIFHTPALLEACRRARRLVVVSSTGVFSERRGEAARIAEMENMVEASGIPFTILRPTMIYGTPGDRNISRLVRLVMRSALVPLPGGGRARFQPVHVTDLAGCIIACLAAAASIGKSYNVPGGSAHSLSEIVSIIARRLGRRVIAVPVPLALASLATRALAPGIDPEQIERLREDKVFSYDEAARDLGYSPLSFEAGVGLLIDAILSPRNR